MSTPFQLIRYGMSALFAACLLTACAGSAPVQKQVYDFGPLISPGTATTQASQSKHLTLSLADVQVAPALDSSAMLYRLLYDSPQQLKPYAQARWSMPPAQLLAQRFKATLSAQGHWIVNAADGAQDLPLLRMEIDEFAQVFPSASASNARLQLRAVLFQGRKALAQRAFAIEVPASSADAAGGAKAMQSACDQVIADLTQWLQTLPSAR